MNLCLLSPALSSTEGGGEGLEFGRSYGGWQRILGMFQSIFNFAAGA
jgi:hypothetical protein